MIRVLFVTNGHGEAAIADRISGELRSLVPDAQADHLALVGEAASQAMREVGPRRAMPSGGLVAMGNVRNLALDFRAGLIGLTWEQASFLRHARSAYDVTVAVGDVYALMMALLARTRTVFVGTAKSVAVAAYGRFEELILRRSSACFVRDEATAEALRKHGLSAGAANAIVDLFAVPDDPAAARALEGFSPAIALFPGSRERAYDDGAFLLELTRDLAHKWPSLGAAFSIARGLDAQRFASAAKRAGWEARATTDESIPFVLCRDGREIVRAWRGALGPLLMRSMLVLGQAGTANEAAAAGGVPVVAFERERDRRAQWYRRRQRGLLGDALVVLPGNSEAAAAGVNRLLEDPACRLRMSEAGRVRMGGSGGARRIAERIVALAETREV